MRKICFVFFLIISTRLFADDGSFYSNGSTLLPLNETTIRMKKEILNLTSDGTMMQVDIYFEFFNPGPEKELTVGFVTPPAAGDVREDEEAHPQIENFMVMINNKLLEYKIIRLDSSGFKLNDKIANGDDFVYYFKVLFKNGSTVIRHSYKYRGGSSVEAHRDFLYRLTTGTTWAGGAIDEFELNIHMESDSYFAIPSSFNNSATPWNIAGIGRISNSMKPPYDFDDEPKSIKMVFIKEGYLQVTIKNFKPTTDLWLTFYQLSNEVPRWTNEGVENDFSDLEQMFFDSAAFKISHLSDDQLRLYKNLEYARAGYDFKDSWLKNKFSKYIWYIPDPSMKPENVTAHYFSKETMQMIANEEKKRKKTKS